MAGVTVFSWITITVCSKIRIPCLMIKNKCFAKKRRMGYCLLAGLLVLVYWLRYWDVTENGINSNENGYSLRELCYNSVWFIAAEKSGQFIASLLNALFTRTAIVIIQNRKRGMNIWKILKKLCRNEKTV